MRAFCVTLTLVGLAAAGRWHVQSNGNANELANGIAFYSKTNGIIASSLNEGLEFEIEYSSNSGVNWTTAGTSYVLSLNNVGVTTKAGIVCGSNGVAYSSNLGANWTTSKDANSGGCASVRRLPDATSLGLSGVFGSNNTGGIAVTGDGGQTFTYYSAMSVMTVPPNNAAFPTSSVWYIACGELDEAGGSGSGGSGSASEGMLAKPSSPLARRAYEHMARGAGAGAGRDLQMIPTLYFGQVLKTTDGGSTWTVVWNPYQGVEMILGIDCADALTCCHSAQAYNGTYIRCTYDGGSTWQVTYNVTSPRAAIFDVRHFGSDWWAIGGIFETPYHLDCYTTVLHSTNNGKTWVVDTKLTNVFGVALDTAADGSGAMFGVAYSNPPTDDQEDFNVILAAQ